MAGQVLDLRWARSWRSAAFCDAHCGSSCHGIRNQLVERRRRSTPSCTSGARCSSCSSLTPFPHRGSRPGAVGTVRIPSGRREARRGRTDPFKVSPGPSSSVEGGHQRKKATIWPSSPSFGALSDGRPTACHGHSQPANHGMPWASAAATLAYACHHMFEWAYGEL